MESGRSVSNPKSKSSDGQNWVKFDNTDYDITTSWSGETSLRESVEVNFRPDIPVDSTASSTEQSNGTSELIDENIRDIPAVPLPESSKVSKSLQTSMTAKSPLQQRDANASFDFINQEDREGKSLENKYKELKSKLVSRPIQSSQSRKRSSDIGLVGKRSSIEDTNDNTITAPITEQIEENQVNSRRNRVRGKDRSFSLNPPGNRSFSKNARRHSSHSIENSRFTSPLKRLNHNPREGGQKLDKTNYSTDSARMSHIEEPVVEKSVEVALSNLDNSRVTRSYKGLNHNLRAKKTLPSHSTPIDSSRRVNQSVERTPVNESKFSALNNMRENPVVEESTSMANDIVNLPKPIHTRTLLTSSVYNNQATGIWITTINMNQNSNVTRSNAAKYLKAFSFHTEREALESAYANAPAKMIPFDENPRCFVCNVKFTVLRRACHCRNCGVCICNGCSISWNKQSVPETYNVKNENSVKVCTSCDTLSKMFRNALIDANYEKVLALYNTGNINLRCQFPSNKGSEVKLPVHCAAEGGSLKLLRWLVDVHHCPIKRIRTGNRYKSQTDDEIITTSKGRSIVEIAMSSKSVDILNYLINVKELGFEGVRSVDIALGALRAVIMAYPSRNEIEDDEETIDDETVSQTLSSPASPWTGTHHTPIKDGIPLYEINSYDSDEESIGTSSNHSSNKVDYDDEESVATTVYDAVSNDIIILETIPFTICFFSRHFFCFLLCLQCILCYDNSIDCVITPCGHQICCLGCSKSLSTCPVCNVKCEFIKIFRP